MYHTNLSIKRIYSDLEELQKNPLEGVALCIPDQTDPYTLHCNIELREGVYEGLLIHLIFYIPKNYPNSPPAVNIAPRLNFGREYHANIYDNATWGNWICTGLTNNFADTIRNGYTATTKLASSGWTPAYTLSSILMHLQASLSNPELPEKMMPSSNSIQKLKDHIKQYRMQIKVNDGLRSYYVTHSYKTPFPFLTLTCSKALERNERKDKIQAIYGLSLGRQSLYENTLFKRQYNYEETMKELSGKLVCSVTKVNVFHESKPILGYPIDLKKDKFERLWPNPIIELLSYETFVTNMQQNSNKLDNFYRTSFQSGLGSSYNYWLPIYIDQTHFDRSKDHILNAIAVIYAGIEGYKANDFQPAMVLKVLPTILVKTSIHFLKGTLHQSVASIEAYCQIYRLLAKLVMMYPELQKAIDTEVANFCLSEQNRHKRVAGDLGEFIVKLSLSSIGIRNAEVNNLILMELLTRQVSWAIEKDKHLALQGQCPNFLERFSIATHISRQFILTMIETAQLLLNDCVNCELEERCGILNDETMKMFRARLEWIQNNVTNDWRVFIQEMKQEAFVPDTRTMFKYIMRAFEMAKVKGYVQWNLY